MALLRSDQDAVHEMNLIVALMGISFVDAPNTQSDAR